MSSVNTNGPIKTRGTSSTPAEATAKMFAHTKVSNDLNSSLARLKGQRPTSYQSIRTDTGHPTPKKSSGKGFTKGD